MNRKFCFNLLFKSWWDTHINYLTLNTRRINFLKSFRFEQISRGQITTNKLLLLHTCTSVCLPNGITIKLTGS